MIKSEEANSGNKLKRTDRHPSPIENATKRKTLLCHGLTDGEAFSDEFDKKGLVIS
jgi:hypothetical protein